MKIAAKVTRKNITLGLLVVIVLAMALGIFRYYNPGIGIGFAYYTPSYLPPNVSIKERRISINKYSKQIEQNFRTVDWVYEIQEYDAIGSSIGTAQQNYDSKSVNPTCSILVSNNRQRYRLCHWIDYERINVHQVIFIKHGTYIRADIPISLSQDISKADIGKFVDSFKRSVPLFMPVLRSNE